MRIVNYFLAFTFTLSLPACLYLASCTLNPRISYQQDVYPIFAEKCADCHSPPYGEGYKKTGLDMGSYESLLQGSIYGPVIVPGNSRNSTLNMLVEGRAVDLTRALELKHQPMTDREIEVLRLWVQQGAHNN
jgi:hypothetical protein